MTKLLMTSLMNSLPWKPATKIVLVQSGREMSTSENSVCLGFLNLSRDHPHLIKELCTLLPTNSLHCWNQAPLRRVLQTHARSNVHSYVDTTILSSPTSHINIQEILPYLPPQIPQQTLPWTLILLPVKRKFLPEDWGTRLSWSTTTTCCLLS